MTTTRDNGVRWLGDREMAAWRNYIVGSALLENRLSRELQQEHDISLADYEILVRLSERAGRQIRMTELAAEVAHSKSRISHQVRRLETRGLVLRRECPEDGRGVLALLTDTGMRLLETAAKTHVNGVREHLIDELSETEQDVLARVFAGVAHRLGNGGE